MPDLARQLTQRVPLFFGLKPSEMKQFLEICKTSECPPGEVICQHGDPSRRFFILLEGTLDVLARDGTLLAQTKPVAVVGEMGFINRKPRSATIRVRDRARMLRIEHFDFEVLLEGHVDFRSRLYRNLVRILSDKLSDSNDLLLRYKKLYESESGEEADDEEMLAASLAEGAQAEGELQPKGEEESSTEGEPQPDEEQEPSALSPGDESEPAKEEEPAHEEEQAQEEEPSAEALPPGGNLASTFYELVGVDPSDDWGEADRQACEALRSGGYTEADIEYAVKWTARNIPGAKRFNMVRLSIREAFEDKWST